MTIATLNIDWAKTYNSKTHILKIEDILNTVSADILILTESVDLNLLGYDFIYKTTQIPTEDIYEEIDYRNYLKGKAAYRTSIYSRYPSVKSFKVTDHYTSICKEFDTEIGSLVVYATIIGTLYNRKPYAELELQNCNTDCLRISKEAKVFCLAGDLNTSFLENEIKLEITGISSRKHLIKLCSDCKLEMTTKNIEHNIDHIFLSESLGRSFSINAQQFVEANILSDHQGILIDIRKKYTS